MDLYFFFIDLLEETNLITKMMMYLHLLGKFVQSYENNLVKWLDWSFANMFPIRI